MLTHCEPKWLHPKVDANCGEIILQFKSVYVKLNMSKNITSFCQGLRFSINIDKGIVVLDWHVVH